VKKTFRPEQCLIVEDAPTVIRSVKQVGFKTLGVATSYPVEKLQEATYVVKDLKVPTVQGAIPELKLTPSDE
jgi:beta-phosphoglucomutase-like phosphatase (HAD superfamily)